MFQAPGLNSGSLFLFTGLAATAVSVNLLHLVFRAWNFKYWKLVFLNFLYLFMVSHASSHIRNIIDVAEYPISFYSFSCIVI